MSYCQGCADQRRENTNLRFRVADLEDEQARLREALGRVAEESLNDSHGYENKAVRIARAALDPKP